MAWAKLALASGSLKREGECSKVRGRTKSSGQGKRSSAVQGTNFIVNSTAVISNLPSLRHTSRNTVLSLLPQRAEAFLLIQAG